MKMAIVVSTAPGNVWTSEEFVALVHDTVATLLDVSPGDLQTADEAEVQNAVRQVCGDINSQTAPAGNA